MTIIEASPFKFQSLKTFCIMCLLELYGTYLLTSNLQFGFKKGLGCSHALLTVRSVADYFTNHGSNVTLCALDMSKAFDKVNHSALFNKL